MKSVRVLAAARRDINSERSYYNRAQFGLGERFSLTVAGSLRNLRENPEAMEDIGSGIRRWPVKGFPHGVLYSITDSEVIIISVFHPSQNPKRWLKRTQQ